MARGGLGPAAVGVSRGPTPGAPRRRGDCSPGGGGGSRRAAAGAPSPIPPEAPGPTSRRGPGRRPGVQTERCAPAPTPGRGRGSETGRGRGAESGFPWGGGGGSCAVLSPPAPNTHTPGAGTLSVRTPRPRGSQEATPWKERATQPPTEGGAFLEGGPPPAPGTAHGRTPSGDSPPGDAHSPPDSLGSGPAWRGPCRVHLRLVPRAPIGSLVLRGRGGLQRPPSWTRSGTGTVWKAAQGPRLPPEGSGRNPPGRGGGRQRDSVPSWPGFLPGLKDQRFGMFWNQH